MNIELLEDTKYNSNYKNNVIFDQKIKKQPHSHVLACKSYALTERLLNYSDVINTVEACIE